VNTKAAGIFLVIAGMTLAVIAALLIRASGSHPCPRGQTWMQTGTVHTGTGDVPVWGCM
jgi:hypothetical protein